MKLGFIILAHHQPEAIRRLVKLLANHRHQVVIHFDSSATSSDLLAVQQIAAEKPDRIRVITRVHCVWGEWSLVEAVLQSLREFETFPELPEYVHLMSGEDFPVRPISSFEEFLQQNPDQDFIESCDIAERQWVKGGLSKERFRFYFPFNFRTHRKSFDRLVRWQRKLKIRRKLPADLRPHMGSQWWTLRWSTCRKVLEFTKEHPEVPRYFKSTWIPDESYFQTVIAKVIPKSQIADLQLMFHHLTPSGRPYVFYNDHLPLVRRLPHFFIRKVSLAAAALREFDFESDTARKRPPSRRLLARIRDLVRARIDSNHTFTTNVPGYYQDKALALSKSSGHATTLRPLTLRSGITTPVVALLLQDAADLTRIETLVTAVPRLCWLGRPFATAAIDMPPDSLARMGLTRRSRKTRELFSRQFTRYLATSAPAGTIPVFAVIPLEDRPDMETLGKMERFLPILVTGETTKMHTISQINAALFVLEPEVVARIIHVDEEKLPRVFRDLAEDSST